MLKLFYIGFGGLAGTLLRYWVSGLVHRIFDSEFPWGTLIINLIGSLIIGFLWGIFEFIIISQEIKLMLFIGFLGSFTTFSTFTLESFNMMRGGEYSLALVNMGVSLFFGIALVFVGYFAGRYFFELIR